MNKKLHSVLLVDDDDVTNFLNCKVIEHTKISDHVEVKLNGREALDYLTAKAASNTELPALILLDINMPVMDGWEFLEACKKAAWNQTQKMNIVLLSTTSNPDDIQRAQSLPMVSAFRSKPLTADMLLELMTEIL